MQKHELIHRVARLVESNHASTFFLNGPPGSGKSYFLDALAKDLPSEIQRSFILGPYQIGDDTINDLCRKVMKECVESGFITQDPPLDTGGDLTKTWQWFVENSQVAIKQTFIVLADLGACSSAKHFEIINLFSNVRLLEGIWNTPNVRIHLVFAGYWDHPALESHFNKTNTSFPYTVAVHSLI